MRFWILTVLFGLFFWLSPINMLKASEVREFHKQLSIANNFYRESQFYLRTGNPAIAGFNLVDLQSQWDLISNTYLKNPPGLYADDKNWIKSLTEVSEHIGRGLTATDAGDLKQAALEIKPIRKLLVDLRRRNGIFIFSDCIYEANQAFAELFKYRGNKPDYSNPNQVDEIRQKLANTIFWYKRCGETAPEKIKNDAQYKRLTEGALDSFDLMWIAIREQNHTRLVSNLQGVASFNRLLYLQFG